MGASTVREQESVVIIGAGPAGLTAAVELVRRGHTPVILEADEQVGGISRTVERDGWRFDLGGHRFFTKVPRVEEFWHSVLPDEDFLLRPRMSRIYYNGRFYDYPLRALNALRNLGVREAILCVASYAWVRVSPPKNQHHFEGWVAARFGWRLYRTFFKTYTEKVWGIPAESIQATWAAQRIKNLSLARAIINSIMPRGRNSTEVTSLIEQFQYPRLGPGMLWEAAAQIATTSGAALHMGAPVDQICRSEAGLEVVTADGRRFRADAIVSTMPINSLVMALEPPAPAEVQAAAQRLKHRDFLTVALVVTADKAFPDNWIYVHDPSVRVGRVQNFGSWSPHMVKPGLTCLGFEYFVNIGDDLWNSDDDELVELARAEAAALNLVPAEHITTGFVIRVPKAYPVYDAEYAQALESLRAFLASSWPGIHPVGRNGMHRYNNQDHSMLTAMLAVENICDQRGHDIWQVNVEEEYHEESYAGPVGTGRSAPMHL